VPLYCYNLLPRKAGEQGQLRLLSAALNPQNKYAGSHQEGLIHRLWKYVQYEPYIIVFLPIMMLFLYFLQLHLQKQDVREVVARADEELAKWKETPSTDIPHAVKALKYHLEELRLDYDL